jgi:pimeloyl-ACP methyl ester carboxylesterase
VPPAHALAYAENLPDARVETIGAAGHYPYLEATDDFVRAAEAFLM